MFFYFSVLMLVFWQNLPRFDIAPSVVRRRNDFFLLFLACKSRNWAIWSEKLPVKLIFSAKTEISGENFSRAEEKNTPKKVVFAPKVAEMDEKGRFWVGNHREGIERKNGLYCRFCNVMK